MFMKNSIWNCLFTKNNAEKNLSCFKDEDLSTSFIARCRLFYIFPKRRFCVKYQLETIPIWEAFEAKTECPLCFLEQKLTKNYTDFFLGGSVMEPDTRAQVNDLGFCPDHFSLLYEAGNKQSLALLAHTHLRELSKKLSDFEKRLRAAELGEKGGSFLPKSRGTSKLISGYNELVNKSIASCAFCDKVETVMKRYAFTIVYTWKKNDDFKTELSQSKGFCIPHMTSVVGMADAILSRSIRNKFLNRLFDVQNENLRRIEDEILWYTQKFDYRNQDKPWKNSMDALPRTIQKLVGRIMKPGK
jgi:hypothetical protein